MKWLSSWGHYIQVFERCVKNSTIWQADWELQASSDILPDQTKIQVRILVTKAKLILNKWMNRWCLFTKQLKYTNECIHFLFYKKKSFELKQCSEILSPVRNSQLHCVRAPMSVEQSNSFETKWPTVQHSVVWWVPGHYRNTLCYICPNQHDKWILIQEKKS